MFKFYAKSTESADYTDITSYISRDSLKIQDHIQEKANVAVFAMESNPLSAGNEVKIYDATELSTVSTDRLITIQDIDYEVKKYRVNESIYLGIGTADEEKVTIEAVDTKSKQITISTASNTFSAGSAVGKKIFAGHVQKVKDSNLYQPANLVYEIDCIDYTKEFDRKNVNDSYANKSAGSIIDEFVREVVNVGLTNKFTTASVESGPTFTNYRAVFKNPTAVMQQLADAAGGYSLRAAVYLAGYFT